MDQPRVNRPLQAPEASASDINVTISSAGSVDHTAGLDEDHLGFRPYVEAIYSYLRNEQTKAPFTISIEGDWGSGKSSFMYQLEQVLRRDELPVVRFNAWRHDKVESMWAAFALHFIKDLLIRLNPFQRIVANIRLRIKRFDWVRGWFTVLKTLVLLGFYATVLYLVWLHRKELNLGLFKGEKISWETILPLFGSTGLIIGLLFFLKGLSDVTGNPFKSDLQKYVNTPNYEGNVAFIEQFHRDFSETVKVLSYKQPKVFIFIDDLDRAEVPKAAELMQGLNMMISNSPKLIFIIGMDREKVAGGIAAKYKDLLPFLDPQQQPLNTSAGLDRALLFGYHFIEKFIQLSFQIPKGSSQFTKLFIDSLSGILPESTGDTSVNYNPVMVIKDGKDSKQFREVTLLLAPYFEHNPRRIKQFVNIFRLRAHIANSTGLFIDEGGQGPDPVTIPQLGKFVALSMLAPQFIEVLLNDPWLIRSLQTTSDISNWRDSKVVMAILNLKPSYYYDLGDYSMINLDIISLMKTSPVVVPQPSRPDAPAGDRPRRSRTRNITRHP